MAARIYGQDDGGGFDLQSFIQDVSTDVQAVAPAAAAVMNAIKGKAVATAAPVTKAVANVATSKIFGIPTGFVALGGGVLIVGTIFMLKGKKKKRR
jgi:hypothetical protein